MDWPSVASFESSGSSSATKIRADGQPMQKRGPKPRNNPALTRKQELARKAQRSHRERKEAYIKAIEQEILQLKNDVSILSSSYESLEKENRLVKESNGILSSRNASLEEENQQLRQALEQCGASWPTTREIYRVAGQAILDSSPQTLDPPTAQTKTLNVNTAPSSVEENSQTLSEGSQQHGIDYEQMGIDFVLSIERPCLCHMRVQPESHLYGHALMASCAPGIYPELGSSNPSDSASNSSSGQGACILSKSGLAGLLERSRQLDLNGEVTPVMVWDMIMKHPRFSEFTPADFEKITKELSAKVKCYGFGAIFEEFEVRDVIENILLSRSGSI